MNGDLEHLADELGDALNQFYNLFEESERQAISRVRHALQEIVDGRRGEPE